MPPLIWNSKYELSLFEIDLQHRILFHLYNELYDAREQKFPVIVLLEDLANHLVYHFKTEEDLMQLENYPDYTKHKGIHDSAKADVADMLIRVQESGTITPNMLQYVHSWITDHLQGEDSRFGEWLRIQNNPIVV